MALRTALAVLFTAAPAVAVADEAKPGAAPSAMTNADIAAHNAVLVPTDPAFIKCRRVAIPGSLVRKARVCRSIADWSKAWQDGNQNARDTYDAMNRGSSNSVEPVDEFTAPGARNRPN
jgi:hypothetical protein